MRTTICTTYDLPEVLMSSFTIERTYWDGTIWRRALPGDDGLVLLSFQPKGGEEFPLGLGVPTAVTKKRGINGIRYGKAVMSEDRLVAEDLVFDRDFKIRDRSLSFVIEVDA